MLTFKINNVNYLNKRKYTIRMVKETQITCDTVSSSSVGPVAKAMDVLQPSRLTVLTPFPLPVWTFPRSLPGTSMSTTMGEILAVKGGTMWARINW